ncbi:MAG: WYL domain-containing protein [Solidesulfovibrio sp.]|uniref:helix-turn-helix transcriptional regulator n=1 Tax=Solidesulfovibrio sp. TaxID=2910990 RepID=UPI0031594F16
MPQEDLTPSEKTVALFALLLFTGKSYTLTELSRKFACAKSTTLRRLDAIEKWAGERLIREKNENEITFKLSAPDRPLIALSPEQIRHLIMCRDMVAHLMPESVRQEINQTIGAAASLVKDFDKRGEGFESVCDAQVKGVIDYSGFDGIIKNLDSAIRSHKVCSLKYQAIGKSEPREHQFAPARLSSFRESLYVHGVKLATQDPGVEVGPMCLAVHRIQSLEITGFTHVVAQLSEHQTRFGIMQQQPVRVAVLFDNFAAAYVMEREWSSDQLITTRENGDVVLEFTASNVEEVVSWVLSFGRRAKVLQPKEIRERVRSEIVQMMAAYGEAVA